MFRAVFRSPCNDYRILITVSMSRHGLLFHNDDGWAVLTTHPFYPFNFVGECDSGWNLPFCPPPTQLDVTRYSVVQQIHDGGVLLVIAWLLAVAAVGAAVASTIWAGVRGRLLLGATLLASACVVRGTVGLVYLLRPLTTLCGESVCHYMRRNYGDAVVSCGIGPSPYLAIVGMGLTVFVVAAAWLTPPQVPAPDTSAPADDPDDDEPCCSSCCCHGASCCSCRPPTENRRLATLAILCGVVLIVLLTLYLIGWPRFDPCFGSDAASAGFFVLVSLAFAVCFWLPCVIASTYSGCAALRKVCRATTFVCGGLMLLGAFIAVCCVAYTATTLRNRIASPAVVCTQHVDLVTQVAAIVLLLMFIVLVATCLSSPYPDADGVNTTDDANGAAMTTDAADSRPAGGAIPSVTPFRGTDDHTNTRPL